MTKILAILSLTVMIGTANPFPEDQLTGQTTDHLVGSAFQLQEEAMDSLKSMQKAAAKEGIKIQVVSAFRSFERQKGIWNRKYTRYRNRGLSPEKAIDRIILYSTIPGTSRHHWGTDIDIVDGNKSMPSNPLNEVHFNAGGRYEKLKKWMDTHSKKFGFYLVYTNNHERQGFEYEPWHYSFAPTSIPMLKAYKNLNLKVFLKNQKIKGHDYLTNEFIERYTACNILDINPELLPRD